MLRVELSAKPWRSTYGWMNPDEVEMKKQALLELSEKMHAAGIISCVSIMDKDGKIDTIAEYRAPESIGRKWKR